MNRPRFTIHQKEAAWFYVFISPWLIGFFVFTLGPVVSSVYFSFTNWDLFNKPEFVGLANFKKLFASDAVFLKALYNTFYYAFIAIPVQMGFSLLFAFLLNKDIPGKNLFRTAYYLPSTVPVVAMSLLFVWFFAPNSGLMNQFLGLFGIDGPNWLLDADWVKPSLIIMSIWSVGGGVVLLLAGMKGIPKELYESAAIDGASRWQEFWKLTLPMISPVVFFNLVIGIIHAFQTFAQVYILTRGGPNNASTMIVPYIFDRAFRFYEMGYASAVAWVLFVIIMCFTLLVIRSSALWVYYEEGRKKA